MTGAPASVSIRPSTFIDAGVVPVDKNLLWKECRFTIFEYTKKDGTVVATTTAARITYQDDAGAEFVVHYSASDTERFVPSEDGKTLVPVGNAELLNKSSNFYVLMNALINAGFPENKLDLDISALDGLYTHNIGIPEPKRSGLVREAPAEGARERVISVPSQILKLPWENKKAVAAAKTAGKSKAAPAASAAAPSTEDLAAAGEAAREIVTKLLADAPEGKPVTRQQVASAAIRAKKSNVAKLVFQADFAEAIAEAGYALDGENIVVASAE